MNFINSLKLILEIYNCINKIKPNIVHAITIKPVIFSGIALKFYKKASFVASISGLGYLFVSKNFSVRFIKYFVKIGYRFALSQKRIKVIFQNNNDFSVIKKICKLKSSESILIEGSGVDLNFFKPLKSNYESDIVLFASRLLISKGILEFVKSAQYLKKQNYKFLIAGKLDLDNPDCISLEQINKWKFEDNIEYLGEVKNSRDIIRKSKVVVLPSYYGEGLPKILIEAAACGKPIITSNHPGCRDAIVPNLTGLLISKKNSQELSKAIKKLMNSPNLCQSMGNEARKLAEIKFDLKHVIKKHMEIYKEVIC